MLRKDKEDGRTDPKVDDLILKLMPDIQELMKLLRELVLNAAPGIRESIKYKLPFYSFNGPLAYLNPQADHVRLGLCKGALIQDPFSILQGAGNETRVLAIRHIHQINPEMIQYLLQQAMYQNLPDNDKA